MSDQRLCIIYDRLLDQFADDCEWPVRRLGDVADVYGGGTPDTAVEDYWNPPDFPWATPTDITSAPGNEISATERYVSAKGLTQTTLMPAGSILMTSRATIGAAKINRVPMAINQGFAAFRMKDENSADYLLYLIEVLRPILMSLGAGTTFLEASRREIRKIRVRWPGAVEQGSIVGVLRAVDDAIHALARKQEITSQLKRSLSIVLLERGFCADKEEYVSSKHWTIPSRWSLTRLKALLAKMEAGSSPLCESGPAAPGSWGVIKVSAVSWDGFNDRENKALPPTIEPEFASEIQIGDIIVSRANTTELCGAVQKVESLYTRLLLCDKTWRITPHDGIDRDWLVEVLRHPKTRRQLEAFATGTSDSMKNIARRDFRNVVLPLPPLHEQVRIAEILGGLRLALNAGNAHLNALHKLKTVLVRGLLTSNIRIAEGRNHA